MRGGPAPSMRQGTGVCLPLKRAETAARCGVRGASSRGRSARVDPEMQDSVVPRRSERPGRGPGKTIAASPGRGLDALAIPIGSVDSFTSEQADRTRPLTAAARIVVETTRDAAAGRTGRIVPERHPSHRRV